MDFKFFYTLLGGLGLFFYGMKSLSEALHSIASSQIKRMISTLTSNRFLALVVGTLVTCVVQSSSITTVMVVGLVDAGLMELTQAIGVIFGANIGTTITGWMITIKVGKYGLLFIAVGFLPLLFAKKERNKQIGRVLLALGFVFMGLHTMSATLKPLKDTPGFSELMVVFSAQNYVSLLACILMGTCLTFIVQSSSAMLGITIALATTGAISFETAMGLVLGENIGTTITAFLASISASRPAKRAAAAHALFNLLGVCVVIPFFWLYTGFIEWFVLGSSSYQTPTGIFPYVSAHIAAGHTIFNVATALVFLPFLKVIAQLVTRVIPDQTQDQTPWDISSQIPNEVLTRAKSELERLAQKTGEVLEITKTYVLQSEGDNGLRQQISKTEQFADDAQKELTQLLLSQSTPTDKTFEYRYELIQTINELEIITDCCEQLATIRDKKDEKKIELQEKTINEINAAFQRLTAFFNKVQRLITQDQRLELASLEKEYQQIRELNENLDRKHQRSLYQSASGHAENLIYRDTMLSISKLHSHILMLARSTAQQQSDGLSPSLAGN